LSELPNDEKIGLEFHKARCIKLLANGAEKDKEMIA